MDKRRQMDSYTVLSQCSGKRQPQTKGDSHRERVFPLLTTDAKVRSNGQDKICQPKVSGNHG